MDKVWAWALALLGAVALAYAGGVGVSGWEQIKRQWATIQEKRQLRKTRKRNSVAAPFSHPSMRVDSRDHPNLRIRDNRPRR